MMTARDILDAAGWIDWDKEGHLVFVAGPHAGDRLGSVGRERIGSLAKLASTPESTRDVLDRYVAVPHAQENPHRRTARQRRSK